jgi:hypothetical protein
VVGVGGRICVGLGIDDAVGGGVRVGCAVSVAATDVATSSTGVSTAKLEHEIKVYPNTRSRINLYRV